MTTCGLYRHSFLGLDHCNVLIMRRDFTTNIKHVLPATPPRDIYFSNVSLKTLLVLAHRRIFHPSRLAVLVYRRFSQPHHHIPGWLMNDSVWAAVLATHNVAPYLLTDVHETCTGPSAIDFVVLAHPSWAPNYLLHSGTLPPEIPSVGSFRGFRLLGRVTARSYQTQTP